MGSAKVVQVRRPNAAVDEARHAAQYPPLGEDLIMTIDERPELRIAVGTWDRSDDVERARLVHLAAVQGYRLVVQSADDEWAPGDDPGAWPKRTRFPLGEPS